MTRFAAGPAMDGSKSHRRVRHSAPSARPWEATTKDAPAEAPSGSHRPERPEGGLSVWAVLFLISPALPWIFFIGPLKLQIDRILLIFASVACLLLWAAGRAGRVRAADIFVLLYCAWGAISLAFVYGSEDFVQPAGMLFIETAGSYFLARVCIRGPRQFRTAILVLSLVVLFLLPFAVYESFTRENLYLDLLRSINPTYKDNLMQLRWGLRRAQSAFDHPILFGTFACSLFALTHMVLGYSISGWRRWTMTALVGAAVFFSLSSGPLSAMAVQAFLIFWNWAFRDVPVRWWILVVPAAVAYVGISALSNQTFFEFYIHYFAFSQDTGWDRIRIWQYGWLSVSGHPWFGIGFHDYERPDWMEPSIDMFWLVNFVRYGIPGGLLMLLAFLWTCGSLAFARGLDTRTGAYRTAFLIAMVGLFMMGWSVHFWNAAYLVFMFLLGSAEWMTEAGKPVADTPRSPFAARAPLSPAAWRHQRPGARRAMKEAAEVQRGQ